MGQCSSHKAKPGKLSVKSVLLHSKNNKKKKMEKHKYPKDAKTEDNKIYPNNEGGNKKANQKYTKGVAMSFGFKRRPSPMTMNNPSVAWDGTTKEFSSDANGNKATGRNATMETNASSIQNPTASTTSNKSPGRASRPQQSRSSNMMHRLNSPSPEAEQALCRTFTRNVTLVARTHSIEKTVVTKPDVSLKEKPGKFTLQTTRLPHPEPVRVIETKTAKTIANNNRKSARMWRRQEEASIKITTLQNPSEDAIWQERLSLDESETLSEAYTPPPLPALPSVFNTDTKKKDNQNMALKSSINGGFLKSRGINSILDRNSPQSSCDQDWINAGEAMADDISLTLSPKLQDNKELEVKKNKNLLMSNSLEMIDSLKDSMHFTLSEEDPKFAAVVTNNTFAGLLDDEILSPVESLFSSSEIEDMDKKKVEESSNSKDVNEKLTASSPGSPVNVSFSLSLSDDKEDFLIDDEIADQPELVFEDRMQASHSLDISPLMPRRRREGRRNRNSLDSLSACDSIGSEDMMMDYELSQTTDAIDSWDKDTSRKFSFNENRKSFFKNLTPRNSSSNVSSPSRSRAAYRSPKRNNSSFSNQSEMSECLTLTKANHSAVQQDIIAIKTMLLTLKRVLNESDTDNCYAVSSYSCFNGNDNNNSGSTEFRLELADLKRQVLFLQGQLEDKEKTVSHLQKQINDVAIRTMTCLAPVEDQNTCNAATQTERIRPSSGMFSVTTSPMDENNSIVRLFIQ